MVSRGKIRSAVLVLLDEHARHGYQIIQEISERSGGSWRPSPGSVYPALRQLEEEGLVEGEERHGRREFHLTEKGRAYVQIHRRALGQPWEVARETATEELLELRSHLEQVDSAIAHIAQAGTASQVAQACRLLADTRRALYLLLADNDSS